MIFLRYEIKMTTSNLLGLLIIMVIYLYVSYYIKVNPSLTLMQSGIQNIDFDMLYNKTPIVVTDRIVDVHDILSTIFKYQYSFISSPMNKTSWLRNSHKFMIVSVRTDQTIQVAHPHAKVGEGNYEFIDVVMRKHQIIILPFGWWISAPSSVNIYQLDDMISKMVSYVF